MARLSNPIGFTRGPVTFFSILIYVFIIVILLIVQTGVPNLPNSVTPIKGVNLTEAWLDLQTLTSSYHPYNSRQNDHVRAWLLERIQSILGDSKQASTPAAYIFNDTQSNLTFSSPGSTSSAAGLSVYFEGTNIIVYIRGSKDDDTDWWTDPKGKPKSRNAVLVNAHYDSVSTGFGATDDGVGVVTVLQLLQYYTTPRNKPKNGVVLLLNNGEEDFLNGARVFSQHPMAKVVSTFLNLEGAGAGGRAALFRSTDAEVTKAYASSPYPFGIVLSGDGFKRGLVRSQTDYVIFNGILGFRGLDVAFIEPRARYHTNQDDSRHTGKQSLWHMLSAAVATTKSLTSQSLSTNLDPEDNPGSSAVWLDLLGRVFVVFRTHTLFALSITLLVVGPIFLLLTLALLYRADKLYMFSGSRKYHTPEGDDTVPLYGWRGFFRFPLIFLLACAAPIALAYLLFKENEFIAHSSEWAVWSMMISSFVFVAWFLCRSADFTRPSSLTRAYGLSWMWVAWWIVLVAATVFEEQFHLAGGYFVFLYAACLFVATLLAYIELFSLPKKHTYCMGKFGDDSSRPQSVRGSVRDDSRPSTAQVHDQDDEAEGEEEATERSGLLRARGGAAFKRYAHQDDQASKQEDEPENHSHDEPDWSKSQWTWLWLLQFILVVPINLIVLGQMALLMVTALHQTGADGSSMFLVYLGIAIFTILIFSPLTPFLHRFTWHLPMFLFLVLVGTLVYNLVAFPFSAENRLKLFFQQEIDLTHGTNSVSLTGVMPFVKDAVLDLPSAAGQSIQCVNAESYSSRQKCSWTGLPPKVADGKYKTWLNFNMTKVSNKSDEYAARFMIQGKNTRACKLVFDQPISDFRVQGQAPVDKRFDPVPKGGSKEIRLWSRMWNGRWTVDVKRQHEESDESGLAGKVVCLWSDANERGIIPAFDEAQHYVPDWVAVTKAGDGLVEGFKKFAV